MPAAGEKRKETSLMKGKCIGVVLLAVLLFGSVSAVMAADGGGEAPSAVTPQVQELRERMLDDPGVMALILAMQNDPEVQALLSDPKIVAAVQAGDMGALLGDPRIMKLLENPRVQEIGQRLNMPAPGK
jgi:hypothetical protein